MGGLQLRRAFATAAALALTLAMVALVAPAAKAATVGTFQTLASSAQPLTSVTVDRTTGVIYAQGNEDTTFYRYDPASDTWTQLANAPINSGNNGGAAYLNGKITRSTPAPAPTWASTTSPPTPGAR